MAIETLSADLSGAQALVAKTAANDKDALRAAAKQFESLMIGMMLKSMRETKFSSEDDPMTTGEGMQLYRDLLDQQWATQLSKGQGMGFADMMVKSMEKYLPSPAGGGAGGEGTAAAAPAASAKSGRPDEALAESGVGAGDKAQAPAPADVGSLSPTPPPRGEGLTGKREFLDKLRTHADTAAAETGVPADFILAHAALESGWGKREITGADGVNSHNLFSIKAGSSWQGDQVDIVTTEYRQGIPAKLTQTFRAYPDYASAFSDYANLLKARYGAALQSGDANGFADNLAAAGYATDPTYATKLKSVIASVASA